MNAKILNSIVEITSQRDSHALGVSILATIAELLPPAFIALYEIHQHSKDPLSALHTLSTTKNQQDEYSWDIAVPKANKTFIEENVETMDKLTCYQTEQEVHHVFIPIIVDNQLNYAIDVSSENNLDDYIDMLAALGAVCENFYTVLSVSERDTLTGLLNRRTYESKLGHLLSDQRFIQAESQQHPNNVRADSKLGTTWLAVIDIDHFKQVNDRFGHIIGDEVLLILSQIMKKSFRKNDLLFRFGGEEFVIIFEPITKQQAELALNKFMHAVRKHAFPMVERITVSIGFACITSADHPTTILNHADQALYYAKEHGRDCVYHYEGLVEAGKIDNQHIEGDIELF